MAAVDALELSPAQPAASASGVELLLVEDDSALQEAIVDTLELAGCRVVAENDAEAALRRLARQRFEMVISDVNLGSGMDGHALLEQIKREQPLLPVLLITAYGSIARSVSAMQAGAVDYLVKPFEPGALIELVQRHALGKSAGDDASPVFVDPASKDLFAIAERVAATDSTVLIAGESGTGKEVLARYIHAHSARRDAPFVAINCAAIPETMLESMLFGHEKGAFTGAHQAAPGKFEQANGGTLLLDEISEMDLSLQAKLLRVLQERELERVGGRKLIQLDVRVLATTNRNLQDTVAEGKFREDLFYRISVFPLNWLALRERRADILPLAEHLLQLHAAKMGRGAVRLADDARQRLHDYHWPGNVRELDNVIQRALILQPRDELDAASLLFDTAVTAPHDAPARSVQVDDHALSANLQHHEFEMIQQAIDRAAGSRKDAAESLGISPRTLRHKLARFREQGLTLD